MGTIVSALEMHHAIEAGERCAVTLVAVSVEFLLRQDVAASLDKGQKGSLGMEPCLSRGA